MKIECKLSKVLQYKDILPGEVFQCVQDTEPTIYMAMDKRDVEGDRYCVDLETGQEEVFRPYVQIFRLRVKVVVEGREERTDEGSNQEGD